MDFKVIAIYVIKKLTYMIENTVKKKTREYKMENLRLKIQ